MPRLLRPAVMLGALATATTQATSNVADLSFRAPFETVNPFSGLRQLDMWEVGGSAVVHRNFARLTAERQGQKGWLSSRTPLALKDWSAMLELRASGASPHLYGDGLAIWLVSNPDHIEGPVFGREDHWNGLGIFFDTFQNLDQSHHHKHPYIYAMVNDGTKAYVPDAEAPDPTKQALPGSVENSGCSYEFRYSEFREDVTVLNHTRVHVTYQKGALKLRLQQTSAGEHKEWYSCFDMKDVTLPDSLYFGISSATGDLVDNHDIIQFIVRPLQPDQDAEKDYDEWSASEAAEKAVAPSPWAMSLAEEQQRDYLRVIKAQTEQIKSMGGEIERMKQSLEFQLAAIQTLVETTKANVDAKGDDLRDLSRKVEETDDLKKTVTEQAEQMKGMKKEVEAAKGGGGWRFPFFFLLFLLVGLAGVGYNRYRKIMKSHLP